MTEKPILPFDEIGAEKLSELVDAFYSNVAKHPKLKPIFPNDLTETARDITPVNLWESFTTNK